MFKWRFCVIFFSCAALACLGNSLGDDMKNRANQLAGALNLDRYVSPGVKKRSSQLKSAYTIRGYNIAINTREALEAGSMSLFQIKDTNTNSIVYGRIIICETFEQAKNQLIQSLVTNSLPIEAVLKSYQMRNDIVNGLCVIKRRTGDVGAQVNLNPEVVYFIVGTSIVSLSSLSENQDVRLLAREMEKILISE